MAKMPVNSSAKVENMAWNQVLSRLESGALPVLAIGAACKEHGFHLPMNTDFLQAEWLVAQAMAIDDHLLVFPTLGYGHYPAFCEYPGSVTLARETFQGIVRDIANSVFQAGGAKLFIIDTGISTITPLDELASEKEFGGRVTVFHSCEGPEYKKTCRLISVQPCGGSHADEIETSLMMAIAPGVVNMAVAVASPNTAAMGPGPLRRLESSSPNFSPSGTIGDPAFATLAKGLLLAAARRTDLAAALNGCRNSA